VICSKLGVLSSHRSFISGFCSTSARMALALVLAGVTEQLKSFAKAGIRDAAAHDQGRDRYR